MQFENSKRNRVISQMLFWTILIGSLSLFFYHLPFAKFMYIRNLMILTTLWIMIYANVYHLVPNFFKQNRYRWYGLSVVVLIFTLTFTIGLIDKYILSLPNIDLSPNAFFTEHVLKGKSTIIALLPIFFLQTVLLTATTMVSTVLESIEIHQKQAIKANKMLNEKLATEVKFLKSQINPHFLFNVLNNIYGLALTKSDQTAEVVLKLSEMLRYVLYDSHKKSIPIEKEINYIKNYIDVQQLKDAAPLSIRTTFDTPNKNASIAPMLLIPFVENAFKHSKVEDTENGWISLKLQGDNKSIHFEIANSLPLVSFTKDKTGGIGLKNVKRRLELEYANMHELAIKKSTHQFSISLKIATS